MDRPIVVEDLRAVTARMDRLLEDYRHYDLTVDILAAWKYYVQTFFRGALFSCVGDAVVSDAEGHLHPILRPDFAIRFPDHDYAVIGEVKASLSIGDDSLRDLCKQIDSYCRDLLTLRPEREATTASSPRDQDILLIVPASSATAAAAFLKKNLAAPGCGQKVVVCQFDCHDDSTRVLFFSRFPLRTRFEGLRDDFLDASNRISTRLDKRIELRIEKFQFFRRSIIAGNDGAVSSLGVLIKVLEAVKELYCGQLRRERHGDDLEPPPLRFRIDELHSALSSPPYESCLGEGELRDLLRVFSRSAPYVGLERDGNDAWYALKHGRRFHPFRKEHVVACITQRYAGEEQLQHAFHLACGLLLQERVESHSRSISECEPPLFPGLV